MMGKVFRWESTGSAKDNVELDSLCVRIAAALKDET